MFQDLNDDWLFTMATDHTIRDILVIGGGLASLSVALSLYRALHTCITFDSQRSRNFWSTLICLTSTWEHRGHAEYRDSSRAEVLEAGLVDFVDSIVTKVEKREKTYFVL